MSSTWKSASSEFNANGGSESETLWASEAVRGRSCNSQSTQQDSLPCRGYARRVVYRHWLRSAELASGVNSHQYDHKEPFDRNAYNGAENYWHCSRRRTSRREYLLC